MNWMDAVLDAKKRGWNPPEDQQQEEVTMSKYIDLKEKIIRGSDALIGPVFESAVHVVLHWLDEHPDQTPGATITESELEASVVHARQCASFTTNPVGFVRSALDILGITVVPAPEPTNAEQIIELMGMAPASMNRRELAKWLDSRGVKAPGGDDE